VAGAESGLPGGCPRTLPYKVFRDRLWLGTFHSLNDLVRLNMGISHVEMMLHQPNMRSFINSFLPIPHKIYCRTRMRVLTCPAYGDPERFFTFLGGNEMNRADLISDIAELTGQPKTEVGATLKALIHGMTGALAKGEKVTLVGFGTFERRTRQARTGRNPRTLAPLRIPASRVPAFRAGQELKDVVDGRQRQQGFEGKATSKSAAKKPAAKKAAKKR
jgi:DNA-binding protein HU-beta